LLCLLKSHTIFLDTDLVGILKFIKTVRHVTGTGSGLLGEIPRVVVQKSALL
jgi:hypothetical protein